MAKIPAVNIVVLTGGSTPERNVALAGAVQVVAALRRLGHSVTVVDTCSGKLDATEEQQLDATVGADPPTVEQLRQLEQQELGPRLVDLPAIKAADLVLLILHGRQGEGGELQALLDMAGVRYTGSDALGSTVAMDKDISKHLFRAAGVPTADWKMWPRQDLDELADAGNEGAGDDLGWPIVVKPLRVGSTVGLTVVRAAGELQAAIETAAQYDREVMLERFVDGRELTVGILGDRALAVGEIIPVHEIFDYECKYTPGMAQEIFPADIDQALADELRRLALRAHYALKLSDFSRVDFIVTPTGEIACLEVNTLPGMTSNSLLPQSAAAVGISFDELCQRICQLALGRSG